MDSLRRQRLLDAGLDVDSALARFMNNEALLEKFLAKFPADPNHHRLAAAMAANDREGALTAAHTLKGVCGNLSMTRLHQCFTDQVAALRRGDLDGARAMMERIAPAYEAVRSAIGGAADGAR